MLKNATCLADGVAHDACTRTRPISSLQTATDSNTNSTRLDKTSAQPVYLEMKPWKCVSLVLSVRPAFQEAQGQWCRFTLLHALHPFSDLEKKTCICVTFLRNYYSKYSWAVFTPSVCRSISITPTAHMFRQLAGNEQSRWCNLCARRLVRCEIICRRCDSSHFFSLIIST